MSVTSDAPAAKRNVAYLLLVVITLPIAVFSINGPDLFQDFLVPFLTGRGVNDDTFMYVWPHIMVNGAAIFADDPLALYMRTAHSPQGYDLFLNFLGAHIDIRVATIALGGALYTILFGFAVKAANLIAGLPGAICTAFILAGSVYVMLYMNGALPRSFGPPLIAMTLYGLISGRLRYVILATILGTLFYYMAGIVSGLALLIYCLMPAGWRPVTAHLSLVRRATLLVVTGAVALSILASSVTRDHDFGPLVDPAQYAAFPEASPEGRYWADWSNPAVDIADITMSTFDSSARQGQAGTNSIKALYLLMDQTFDAFRTELGLTLLLVMLVIMVRMPRCSDALGPLSVIAAGCVLYMAAVILFPLLFFPTRFFEPVIPVVIAVMVPWVGQRLLLWFRPSMSALTQTVLIVLAVSLVLIATGRPQWARLDSFSETEREVFAFTRELPEDALIAGWPRDMLINAMPYFGERRVLISYETHQGFREDFILLTRARMQTLVDALVAGDLSAFDTLRDRFGVTHMLVTEALFDNSELTYFAPFQARIDAISDQSSGAALLRSGAMGPIVMDTGAHFIVELRADAR